ncbi:MAG: DUF2807 domain-containing protein [Filimonas sp.]|nr:DUF2807 domain-containing protein [Filimonas sp.]
MKKSLFFIILAVAICLVTLTAANLKLGNEYTKGNFVNNIIKNPLPAFSYIKEIHKAGDSDTYSCQLEIINSPENVVAYDSTRPRTLTFTVQNDTLFIARDEKLPKEEYASSFRGRLFIPAPKALSTSQTNFIITGARGDSLSIYASGSSEVSLSYAKVNSLKIIASDASSVQIMKTDSIPFLQLSLRDKSSFTAADVKVLNRQFQASDSTTISLSGRSINYFGIK